MENQPPEKTGSTSTLPNDPMVSSHAWVWLAQFVVALLALGIFHIKLGIGTLDVTNIGWLLMKSGDAAADFLAWEYYLATPWTFPLGMIEGYCYPAVVSIGNTGAIPLVAIPVKLLAPYLPDNFQYFGWWILSCFLLQGFFSVRLFHGMGIKHPVQLILAATMMVMAPALLFRLGHLNLCCHWFIIGSFWLYFSKSPRLTPGKKTAWQCFFTFVSAATHPYLLVFSVVQGFALFFKLWVFEKKVNWLFFILGNVLNICVITFTWSIVGNFTLPMGNAADSMFGYYSANVNALFNSLGYATVIPAMRNAFEGQFEGYAYLGTGVFLLLIPGIIGGLLAWKKTAGEDKKGVLFLFLISLGLAFFAFSNVVTWNHTTLFKYPLPGFLDFIAGTFRSSGRYIWALHYLVIILAIKGALSLRLNKLLLESILLLALVVQFYDLYPLLSREYYHQVPYETNKDMPVWNALAQASDKIITYPLFVRRHIAEDDYVFFNQLGYRHRKPVTCGHLARRPEDQLAAYGAALQERLDYGLPGEDSLSVFVMDPHYGYNFETLTKSDSARAYLLDGYLVALPGAFQRKNPGLVGQLAALEVGIAKETLFEFLQRHYQHTLLIAVKDEATAQLCDVVRVYMSDRGSVINNLAFRGSYCGIWWHDMLLAERLSPDEAVNLSVNEGESLQSVIFTKKVSISSGGAEAGNFSQIRVNDREYSPNFRGMNIAVLDDDFNVLETVYFDTYQECFHTWVFQKAEVEEEVENEMNE